MADIVRNKARIALVHPLKAEVYDFVAAVAIEAGQPVFLNTSGKVGLADANGSGADTLLGIALTGAGAGQAVSVLKSGAVYGYTLAGAYGSFVYVSNTVGELADAAGTASLPAGMVISVSDNAATKVLYIDIPWTAPTVITGGGS